MAEKKKVTKKTTGSRTRKPKEIEVIDAIVDVEEETIEEVKEVKAKKTYRELRNELRSKKNEIEVEILNLNTGSTTCRDRNGRIVFDLHNQGDREFVVLADIYEVASRYKRFFEKHLIAIIDVDSDEYCIEDIIEYLGLNEIYDEIENYDTDYIMQILKLEPKKFEKFVEGANEDLVRIVSSRAADLFKQGKFDSRLKEKALSERLGREDLFEL